MLLTFEMTKLIRSRRLIVAGAIVVLFLVLMLLGFYTYAQNETGGQVEFRYTYENESYFNGLTFALYAFYFGALMILPIFAASEGGSQIVGEARVHTMRLLLLRPLSYNRIFLIKLLTSVLYLIGLVGLLLLLSLLVGLFSVGWGDLNIYPGVLQMTSTQQHLSQGQALRAFLWAWPLVVVAMLTPLAMSFMLATWMKNPANTVAASVAI
jgi:ABC-type transport system involved in multi-copper enzyme maturation permease subunit